MHRAIDLSRARRIVLTAEETRCPDCEGGLVISQHRDRYVQRLNELLHQRCRDKSRRGDGEQVRRRLLEQGGIYLMVDGVQFDDRSPVLYRCWDAKSGTPLFGERLSGELTIKAEDFPRASHEAGGIEGSASS